MQITCKFCGTKFTYQENGFVCTACSYLNPLTEIDYFSYLFFPMSLDVNPISLEKNYLKLMLLYHPDKYVKSDEEQKTNSIVHSSFLNNAYKTLKSPLDTIGYCYKIANGVEILDDEKLLHNPAITMEFFDLYEKLDTLTAKAEKTDFENHLNALKASFITEISNLDFQKNKDLVQTLFIKIRYIDRITEKVSQKVIT